MNDYDVINIRDIAPYISELGWKLLDYLNKKEYNTMNEMKGLLKCGDIRLFTELRILETALLLKRKFQDNNGKKKVYYITLHGMEILKYKPEEE